MAFRGRGRGRGGPGGFHNKQEPFVLFPVGVVLPDIKAVTIEENLVRQSLKLQNFWKASPYYLEDNASKKAKNIDIERYSDRNKVETAVRRDSLAQILEHKRFPAELTAGSKGWQQKPSRKRVRWNPDSDMKKLDLFEKLEERLGTEEKEEKEKKEGDEDEEDEDHESEDVDDEFSDDDYNQNQDFDDDEDDFNMEDEGDDATYD